MGCDFEFEIETEEMNHYPQFNDASAQLLQALTPSIQDSVF
jgi:hypothetical protein